MDGLRKKQKNARQCSSGANNGGRHASAVAHSILFSSNKRRVIATYAIGSPVGIQPASRTLDGVKPMGRPVKSTLPLRSQFWIRQNRFGDRVEDFFRKIQTRYSLAFAWKTSIMAALCLGMVSTTFLYHHLGPQASAESMDEARDAVHSEDSTGRFLGETSDVRDSDDSKIQEEPSSTMRLMKSVEQTALAAASTVDALPQESENEEPVDEETGYAPYFLEILAQQGSAVFEHQVRQMVQGYPIEAMVPIIASQDRRVAAFLVGIAKKESNWGKRVPVLDGKDCYNYWGYRGIRNRMGTGGHTCFDNPEDAVNTVAKRIERLVQEEDRLTPNKMVVWKCGYSCAGHSRQSVQKWISDVDLYFEKLNKTEE